MGNQIGSALLWAAQYLWPVGLVAIFIAIIVIRKQWMPGYLRIIIWSERTSTVGALWQKPPKLGERQRGTAVGWTLNDHQYGYLPEAVYYQRNIWRTPTLDYDEGVYLPRHHGTGTESAEVDEIAGQQIIHELFAEFKDGVMKLLLYICIGVAIFGVLVVWIRTDKVDQIATQTQGIYHSLGLDITPTPVTGGTKK